MYRQFAPRGKSVTLLVVSPQLKLKIALAFPVSIRSDLILKVIDESWVPLICLIVSLGCTHRVRIQTVPPDAAVYQTKADGSRGGLLGRTPLEIPLEAGFQAPQIEISHTGYLSERITMAKGLGEQADIQVQLQAISEKWIKELPTDLTRSLVETAVGDHIQMMQSVFAHQGAAAPKDWELLASKYARLSVFHYVLGHHYLLNENFGQASASFQKALELDPQNKEARRMLGLSDMKLMSNFASERARSLSLLEAGMRDIVQGNYGRTHRVTQGKDKQAGFEVHLSTDSLFAPGSHRLTRQGLQLVQQLVGEFSKLTKSASIVVECHTDSNVSSLLNQGSSVSKGTLQVGSLLEMTSLRAASFLEALVSEGAQFQSTAIAGYGNSKPLAKETGGDGLVNAKAQQQNRRMVLRISLEDVLPPASTLKQSIEESIPMANRPKNTGQPILKGNGNRANQPPKSLPADPEMDPKARAPKVTIPDLSDSEEVKP
jgi:outer membrane protein OmpA-like peptidoglycan-associated protein